MNNSLAPTRKELIDLFWRVLWTFVSVFLGGLSGMQALDIGVAEIAALAGLSAAANVLLVFARQKLGAVNPPGESDSR